VLALAGCAPNAPPQPTAPTQAGSPTTPGSGSVALIACLIREIRIEQQGVLGIVEAMVHCEVAQVKERVSHRGVFVVDDAD